METLPTPGLYGGHVVNVFYLASDYRKLTNYPRFGDFRLKTATPFLRQLGNTAKRARPSSGEKAVITKVKSPVLEVAHPRARRHHPVHRESRADDAPVRLARLPSLCNPKAR